MPSHHFDKLEHFSSLVRDAFPDVSPPGTRYIEKLPEDDFICKECIPCDNLEVVMSFYSHQGLSA